MQKLSFMINNRDVERIARFIWQKGFDICRKNIYLNDMDSMLVDLSRIEMRISYAIKYSRITKFVWYINESGTGVHDYTSNEEDEDSLIISFNPRSGELEIEIPKEFI